MGICSKAKDIIYSSKLCDVNLRPKEKEGDNIVINSIPNTNNNTFNVDNNIINVVNINNKIIKNESKNEHSDENKKLGDDNSVENKDKTDISKHSNKKLKRKRYNNNNKQSSNKLVFKSSKEVAVKIKIESDIHNLKESNGINDIMNNNENSQVKNNEEKFKRRSQKRGGTHIHNLPEKLRGIEMSIPVFQESLITQNFGNPEKYYKKVRNLGSGSYGTVYLAKNNLKDNLVAIKVIEKIPANIIDDMEIKNEINILKSLSHPNIVKIFEFFDTALNYYIVKRESCLNILIINILNINWLFYFIRSFRDCAIYMKRKFYIGI